MSRTSVHAPVWRIDFQVPDGVESQFSEFIDEAADSVAMFKDEGTGMWRFSCIFQDRPDVREFISELSVIAASCSVSPPDVDLEELAGIDWVTENLRSFPPLAAGRFFVHGSHWEDGIPPGAIALKVDAGAAFGSGEHATTKACLLAIDGLARAGYRPVRTLDLGCGTAILGMGVAKLHRTPVIASDIDPVAVRVAAANARDNHLSPLVDCMVSNGLVHPVIRDGAPYDLIVANILARPLVHLAGSIVEAVSPGGHVVLSGLLNHQEQRVLSAYRPRGMRLVNRYRIDGWTGLVLQAP